MDNREFTQSIEIEREVNKSKFRVKLFRKLLVNLVTAKDHESKRREKKIISQAFLKEIRLAI